MSEHAIVRPGDKLIVARADRISMQDGERLKARIGELLPGIEPVIISECTGLAVYRDEPTGIIQLSQTLTEDEVQSLRERGVIDKDGRTFGDKMTEYFERKAGQS